MTGRRAKSHRKEKTAFPLPPPQTASMTECTGILPAQIETDAEGENVANLENVFSPLPPDEE